MYDTKEDILSLDSSQADILKHTHVINLLGKKNILLRIHY